MNKKRINLATKAGWPADNKLTQKPLKTNVDIGHPHPEKLPQ